AAAGDLHLDLDRHCFDAGEGKGAHTGDRRCGGRGQGRKSHRCGARRVAELGERNGNDCPGQISWSAHLTSMWPFAALTLLIATFACQAEAAPQRVEISPPASEVALRAYKLGLLPIDGKFTHFDGWLIFDPDDRTSCRVELRVEVASLRTEDPAVLPVVIGPDFMDAASFPQLLFAGRCAGREIG